ncbi:MAG: CrcB family protein [Xanthomonadaceae bacterium]|nr:CrcB family protein [Xanthomonadaceae bacterium]
MSPSELLSPGALGCVAGGSAIGALARFELSRRMAGWLGERFPWATLVINVSGCLFAGALFGMLLDSSTTLWSLLLVTGALGSYTTVSSFSLETLLLARRTSWRAAVIYVALSVAGCIAAVGVGVWLFRQIVGSAAFVSG